MKIEEKTHMRFHRESGFSLIELMVVVAIIGILASIALPSYAEHQRKARRTSGQACVSTVAQGLERYYTTALTYVGAPNAATLAARCEPEVLQYYTIATSDLGTKAYKVSATAKGKQAGDSGCSPLTVNQAGAKTPLSCW